MRLGTTSRADAPSKRKCHNVGWCPQTVVSSRCCPAKRHKVPPSLLLSLWHSSCMFRRGGCLGLCSFFWWLTRFHQKGKRSQPFTIGLFAAVLLTKQLDIQLLLLEEGEYDSKLREFALGKVGNTIYWHKSLPWCDYSWGWRSLESKLSLFHFCYWCLSGLIMYEITERGGVC